MLEDEDNGQREMGMSPEQWEKFRNYTLGFGEQDEYGVDLPSLREKLCLTPTERLEKHHHALRMVQEIRRARRAAELRQVASDA